MRKQPRMSEEMYNKMKSFFTNILLNANDEQAMKIANAIADLADKEIERLENEMFEANKLN